MLSDKPKLIFTDISGNHTIEARLPCQQIKQAKQYQPTPTEAFNYALMQCGEAKQ